jgi:hypothetical protein
MPVKIEYPLVSVPKDKRLAMSYLFAIYRCNARNRDLVFEISKEQCFTLFKESCAYCGIPYSNKREGFQYNGIDRIDNQIGYVWSNCIPCCRICNRMKGNQSLIDFLSLVDRIKKLPQ